MANLLRGVQEMGSHAVDIYDYLLAGVGEWADKTQDDSPGRFCWSNMS